MQDIADYENFVRTWNDFPYQGMIERVTVNYRYGVQGENIPSEFVVHDFGELVKLISSKNKNAVTAFIERCKSLSNVMHYDNLMLFTHCTENSILRLFQIKSLVIL